MLRVPIRIASMGTHNIGCHDKIRNSLKYPVMFVFLSYRNNSSGLKTEFEIAMSKRAISVLVIEVLLWLFLLTSLGWFLSFVVPCITVIVCSILLCLVIVCSSSLL